MPRTAALVPLLLLLSAAPAVASHVQRQQPSPQDADAAAVTPEQVRKAIDQLGNFDFRVRNDAARTIRRAAAAVAVPALLQAAKTHGDGYVRFRALVLLSGFNDPRTRDVMAQMIGEQNDRLRSVAYTWFEHNRDKAIVPRLLEAVNREESEFVRPALTRALAAYGDDPRVRPVMSGLVMKGQAFFRSIVIEALGDDRAAYAIGPITSVAKIDGPLQDDAALALGKIGDKTSLPVLASLQQTAPRESQPAIAAAICLLGVNCASHHPYITKSLHFAIANIGFQELLRGSAAALATLGAAGHKEAIAELIEIGAPTRDPARAAIALALGTAALRNTPALLEVLESEPLVAPAAQLLRDAFDMLEEDFEEERFFVAVRRAYWQAPEGSARRKAVETLIKVLEF
jgi:HEAT repeat protein